MAPPFETGLHEIADGVNTYLQPPGTWGLSNAGLIVGEDASLLVDTFFDLAHTRAMLDAVGAITSASPIGTVVNTHAHGDHSWGNELVAHAQIVASRRCAAEMAEASPELYAAIKKDPSSLGATGEFFARIFDRFDFGGIRLTLPTRTFDGELRLTAGGREVQLIEVGPAHTAGDVLVYLPRERVLFSGDVLFVGGHPVTFTGSVPGWIAALDRVLGLDADVIVPGHGPVCGKPEAAALRGYFEYVTAEARARFDAGMGPLDAARDIPMDAYDSWHLPERVGAIVKALYRSFADEDEEPNPVDALALMAQLAC